jgi:putative tryptophan/tyrosine transport system substrate-binding protein
MMRRRDFITLLVGAAAWPAAARAQQPDHVRRIGALMGTSAENDVDARAQAEEFQQSLAKLGWIVGRNLRIDYRWGVVDDEGSRTAVAELLRLAPEVVLANGSPAVAAAQQATRTVPIVFVNVVEPVAQGFVQSLAQPSGNITGFTNFEPTMGSKWLELLKKIAPEVTHVAIMHNPDITSGAATLSRSAELAAPNVGVEAFVAPVHTPAEIETVLTMLGREPGGGLIVPTGAFTRVHRKLIVELAARFRLPALYPFRYFAEDGGLVSYGIDRNDQVRHAAAYVDRILRGEKPGDLPVQQPTKFEFVINLKAARALGLTVSDQMQFLADEVIE